MQFIQEGLVSVPVQYQIQFSSSRRNNPVTV